MKGIAYWTPEELEILRSVYPTGGIHATMAALPHRTRHGIESKAIEGLGLRVAKPHRVHAASKKTRSPQFWTEERRAQLGEAVAQGGYLEGVRRFPGCSYEKIKTAARRFGFRPPSGRKWPDERFEVLRAALERGGTAEAMRQFPDEKKDALRHAAQYRGLTWGKPQPRKARVAAPKPAPAPITSAPVVVPKRRPKLTPEMQERWSRLTFTMAMFE